MKRVMIVIAFICAGLLLYLWNEGRKAHAHALRMICWDIANDLVTNTNSERVALANSWSGTNFSRFLAGGAAVEAVRLGDKPIDALSFQEHAAARLCFTNQRNKHFELRIRDVKSVTHFQVIGAGFD